MKKYLPLILFIIFCACSPSLNNSLSSLPKWYVSPKQNNLINLYGVGEGYTLEEATNSALKNLASKLMVSISAETTNLIEENKFDINQESRQQINETIEKITFINYKVSNSTEKDSKIYAEVSVDHEIFLKESIQKLSDLNQKMSGIYKDLANKNILEKRNDLVKIMGLASQATSLNYIIQSLEPQEFNKKENLKQYNFYQQSLDEILNKIEFYIEPNSTPQTIKNVISSALSKENMKLTKIKNLNNSNLVIIDIKSNLVTNKIYESNIAKLKINLELISNQNKVLGNNLIEIMGSSVISQKEAISAAAQNLSDKINQEGILKILSIESYSHQI